TITLNNSLSATNINLTSQSTGANSITNLGGTDSNTLSVTEAGSLTTSSGSVFGSGSSSFIDSFNNLNLTGSTVTLNMSLSKGSGNVSITGTAASGTTVTISNGVSVSAGNLTLTSQSTGANSIAELGSTFSTTLSVVEAGALTTSATSVFG